MGSDGLEQEPTEAQEPLPQASTTSAPEREEQQLSRGSGSDGGVPSVHPTACYNCRSARQRCDPRDAFLKIEPVVILLGLKEVASTEVWRTAPRITYPKDWQVLASQSIDSTLKLEADACDPITARLIDKEDVDLYWSL
ncbi:hypothetical protein CKAH01_14246 [Colletotrichum kahawae]|uniref:Uncharacterized protein n=1 Tax=Colletotrichum kahawae TaxID=34407 RepID=A0AAD9YMV8_COLKA|nr:hypothetical protein CKAH01_14246 [Colletotrichum kahawae]